MPGRPLRALLDHAAETGRKFTQDEATADLMLAIDRGDERPVRYYAKRWRWAKSTVHRRMDEMRSDVDLWRSFYSEKRPKKWDAVGRSAEGVGHDTDQDVQKIEDMGRNGTPVGRSRDSIEQTQITTTTSLSKTRAREGSDPYGRPVPDRPEWMALPNDPPPPEVGARAVEMFIEAMGRVSVFQDDEIRHTIHDLDAWGDTLRDWRTAEYSPRNVPGILNAYRRRITEAEAAVDAGRVHGRGSSDDRHPAIVTGQIAGRPAGKVGNGPRVRGGSRRKRDGELSPAEYFERSGFTPAEIERLVGDRSDRAGIPVPVPGDVDRDRIGNRPVGLSDRPRGIEGTNTDDGGANGTGRLDGRGD